MSVNRISARYAKSLMDLAIERNELDQVKSDVDVFSNALKSRDLYLLLKSPIINATKKSDIINKVFGNAVGLTLMAFLSICIRKGREKYLPEIVRDFQEQYKAYKKISTVIVTTAVEPDAAFLSEIQKKLLSSSITMEQLEIITKTDESLIGGFIIEVGDKLYDASIAHKLDKFRKEFVGNQYVKSF